MRVWVTPPGKPLRVALMVAEDKGTNGATRRGEVMMMASSCSSGWGCSLPHGPAPCMVSYGREPTRAVPRCERRCGSPEQKEVCSSEFLQEAARHPAARSVLADHGQEVPLRHLELELRSHYTGEDPGQEQSKAVIQGSFLFCLMEDPLLWKILAPELPQGAGRDAIRSAR